MLVHICCSVDSHYFLSRLQKEYPNEKLTGYFYNPNIHPKEEYDLRLLDVKRSCERLGVPLLEGEYELKEWLSATSGLEDEPEKGERCLVCFDERLSKSANIAKEMGFKRFTTTLLMSPKKSFEQLKLEAKKAEIASGLEFVFIDFRKGWGTNEQFKIAKEERLYMQDYCGCIYALNKQREHSQKEPIELYSDISNRALPNSFKERVELYEKRLTLEKEGKGYTITRERFLNYRLKRAILKEGGREIESYTLFYSTTRKELTKSEAVRLKDGLFYAPKFEGFLVGLALYNELANTNHKQIKELLEDPLELELCVREILTASSHSLSPIIVTKEPKETLYELFLQYEQFVDLREVLIEL